MKFNYIATVPDGYNARFVVGDNGETVQVVAVPRDGDSHPIYFNENEQSWFHIEPLKIEAFHVASDRPVFDRNGVAI